jgi:hypothetical protein
MALYAQNPIILCRDADFLLMVLLGVRLTDVMNL